MAGIVCECKQEEEDTLIICGLDLSKNHYALSLKEWGSNKFAVAFGWHSKSRVELWRKKLPPFFTVHYLPPKAKDESIENHSMKAADLLCSYILSDLMRFSNDWFLRGNIIIAIEGYAYGGSEVVGLAEVTGIIKWTLHQSGCAIRTHDPQSVKMWAGKGNYTKEQMLERYLKEFPDLHPSLMDTKLCPAFDIVDAFFLKTMMEWEVKVRIDPRYLEKLNDRQLQIFNRVTKSNPVNLLNRPFLAKEQPIFKE